MYIAGHVNITWKGRMFGFIKKKVCSKDPQVIPVHNIVCKSECTLYTFFFLKGTYALELKLYDMFALVSIGLFPMHCR